MIDTEATRDRIRELEMDSDGYLKTINLFWDVLKDVDAQAEENKQLREALNYYADVHWSMVRGGPGIQVAVDALRTDTEEGHWDCICTNPTPSSPSVEGKRKCLFCAREMVYRTEKAKK